MPAEFKTAGEFNKVFIEKLESRSMFKILIENFNYYFFSHVQNVELSLMDIGEVLTHFYDFFVYCGTSSLEPDISRAYAAYYV